MIDLNRLRSEKKVISLQGREFITHAGLLWLAHEAGIKEISTELVSWDPPARAAVIKATASGERGIFTGYGDASPENVGRNIANATLRMAETRAVNRALRLYTGLGMTSAEEMPGRQTPTQESRSQLIESWLETISEKLGVETSRIRTILAEVGKTPEVIPAKERHKVEVWLARQLEET